MTVSEVLLVVCVAMSVMAIFSALKCSEKSLCSFQYNTFATPGFTLGIVHDIYDYEEYTYACVRIGIIFFQFKLETYTLPETE